MTIKPALAALLAASTLAFAPAAHAGQAESYSVAISYADLNLASSSGRLTLQGRIRSAADRVCGVNGVVALHTAMAAAKCADQFEAQANDQVTTQLASRQARTIKLASR